MTEQQAFWAVVQEGRLFYGFLCSGAAGCAFAAAAVLTCHKRGPGLTSRLRVAYWLAILAVGVGLAAWSAKPLLLSLCFPRAYVAHELRTE